VNRKIIFSLIVFPLSAVFFFNNCSRSEFEQLKSTTLGNPMTEYSIHSFSQLQDANGQTIQGSFAICIRSVTLRSVAQTVVVDYPSANEIPVPETGVDLQSLSFPEGNFTEISLNLESRCGTGRSLRVTNGNGAFTTQDSIAVRFLGTFDGSTSKIGLYIQSLVTNLYQATQDSDVAPLATAVTNSFVAQTIIPASQLSIASATADAAGAPKIFDGNLSTRWIPMPLPQEVVINLGGSRNVSGVHYEECCWTRLIDYEIYLSNDEVTWGAPVRTGSIGAFTETIAFTPRQAAYLKFRALSASGGNTYGYIGELSILEK
jgi:hypothetical protein